MLSSEEIKRRDQEYVIRAWSSVAEPTVVAEAESCILRDPEGREYIDCSSGLFVANAGHSHPEVIKAIQDQASKVIQVSVLQTTLPLVQLAEKLAQLTPGDLKKSYFTTGGAESVEVAIKMTRQYTGKYEIIALKNGFHGLSGLALSATGATSYKAGFGPLTPGILRAPHAYCYRCGFDLSYPSCDLRCAQEIENIIKDTALETVSEGSIAAVLIEPVQGRGCILPPDKWLPLVREICTKHGLLLLVDEIQTGFGRTGRIFACQHQNVVPDILILAKNVGGGISAGAVVTTEEIAKNFRTGTAPTLAGNALACRAGLAQIDVIEKEGLWKNAAAMGQRFKEGFEAMATNRYVGEARFKGLMGGLELVRDKKNKEPLDKGEINKIKEELLKRGVVISASGPFGNVFRVQPPLVITQELVDQVIQAFDEALSVVMARNG